MEHIQAIKCGTMVTLKMGNTEAMVTGVIIRFDSVRYEVSYFYNGDMCLLWVAENEFEYHAKDKQKLGFYK